MTRLQGSWKTTVPGLISAGFGYIGFTPDDFSNHMGCCILPDLSQREAGGIRDCCEGLQRNRRHRNSVPNHRFAG